MTPTQRTSIIICTVVAIAAFLLGWALKGSGSPSPTDTPSPTPTDMVSATVTPTLMPLTSPSPARAPKLFTVRLNDAGPSPVTLTIAVGDSVTFLNTSTLPYWPASSNCAGFDARRALQPGERYTLRFTAVHTCTYADQSPGAAGARQGTVVVQ